METDIEVRAAALGCDTSFPQPTTDLIFSSLLYFFYHYLSLMSSYTLSDIIHHSYSIDHYSDGLTAIETSTRTG